MAGKLKEVFGIYANDRRQQGAAMPKTACIVARRGVRQQQETGIRQINEMLQEIKETENMAEAIKWGYVAAGYVNGMYCGDLMGKSEMHDVIQVIDQTFAKTELRIRAAHRPFWKRIWKGAKA